MVLTVNGGEWRGVEGNGGEWRGMEGSAVTPLTTYTCGVNCEWRGVEGSGGEWRGVEGNGGECSDTTYYIQMYTDVEWRGVQ